MLQDENILSEPIMTQESLLDALVYAEIPSRTVITAALQDGLLKKSIFASNAFIYHFDDIRDGIDLVLRGIRGGGNTAPDNCGDKHSLSLLLSTSSGIKAPPLSISPATPQVFHLNFINSSSNCLKMNELFDSEEVRFACSRASEDLLNSRRDCKAAVQLATATILISIDFLNNNSNGNQVHFDSVEGLVKKIKGLLGEFGGPVLAFSDIKRNLRTGSTFKFFAEFYRISDCKRFLQTCESIGGPVVSDEQGVKVSFEGVHLYDIDREALFFSEQGNCNDNTNTINSESFPNSRRKDSISSTISSINSSTISAVSESSDALPLSCGISYTNSSTSFTSVHSMNSNPANFEIDLWKIENNLEKRTTCMIRNIPNKYTQQMIFDLVNETHRGCFDFLYLRMDFRNRCNVGYAFINFTDPQHILSFARRVNGKRWARFNSDKICLLTFARIQGTAALIEKFRNSKVMFEAPAYRPKLFHTDGPLTGQEIPFPS